MSRIGTCHSIFIQCKKGTSNFIECIDSTVVTLILKLKTTKATTILRFGIYIELWLMNTIESFEKKIGAEEK